MPSSLPLPSHEGRCQARHRCPRTPCFRAGLSRTLGQLEPDRTVDTCADHLGDIVQALVRWADENGFGRGYLTVCVIGPSGRPGASAGEPLLSSFPFATISLETWKRDNRASSVATGRNPARPRPDAAAPVPMARLSARFAH